MVRYITLAGKKQVGKDTSARYIKSILEQHTTLKVHVTHFADALKDACEIIFGIPRQKMETELGKQELTDIRWPHLNDNPGFAPNWMPYSEGRFMTVREVLQFVGTELFRTQLDPDIWVQSVFRKQFADDDIVVVADCRFPNEAELGKQYGLLFKVERDTGLLCDGHASETALDNYEDYDGVIRNNGTFTQLRTGLFELLSRHGLIL